MNNNFNLFKTFFIVTLFLLLTACAANESLINTPATPPVAPKFAEHPRIVLVLGSGGVRGYAHLGVLQALEEAHVPVDVLIGSSAGSVVATLYADNQSFKKTYDIMMPAGFWDYADLGNIAGSGGIIKGYQLENFLLAHMSAHNFNELKKRVIVATSDIDTGELYPIESGPIAPAVLASAAIPGAVKPVKLYGHTLIDGGVLSPVPVELAKALHPKIIIAVDISQQIEHQEPDSALGVLNSAVDIMGHRITEMSINGANIVIRPNVGDVNLFDIRKKNQMYLAGLAAARKEMPKILALLKADGIARD